MTKTKKILLIEDNLAQARLLYEILKSDPIGEFELLHVQRLKTAVAQLQDNSIDAILLDLNLPDAQGMEALAQLIQLNQDVPVIVLSNSYDQQLLKQIQQHGARACLNKRQITFQRLVQVLQQALGPESTEI